MIHAMPNRISKVIIHIILSTRNRELWHHSSGRGHVFLLSNFALERRNRYHLGEFFVLNCYQELGLIDAE